jgi:hypothetical protein
MTKQQEAQLADYRASVKIARRDLATARRKATEAIQEITSASFTLVTMIRDCEALEKQLITESH